MEKGLNEILKMQDKVISTSLPHNKDLPVNQAMIQFLELESMLKIAEVVANWGY